MLMFRAEQKAKRVSKIKSKAYRKIHRKEKERLKEQMKELESGSDVDEEEEMEERLKAERDRARERATLKHKNTSKWAKNILSGRHGEHNQEARNELDAQLRRGAELRSKIQGRDIGDDSDDSEDYSDDAAGSGDDAQVAGDAFDELSALEAKEEAKRRKDEEEFERVGGKKGVYNMKFMKDARERQYAQIRGEVDDFVTEMHGLGAQEREEDSDDAEDNGETVVARKGSQQDAGSSVVRPGQQGARYVRCCARCRACGHSDAQEGFCRAKRCNLDSKPANLCHRPVNGSKDSGVEVGGDASIVRSTSRPTKPSLSSNPPPRL